ncbi:MAG: M23 family metallopeptidase [Acidobacteria bacterium]|nr:M23 family metallopeptidase [Acidobacteriota bacterium]
MLPRRYTLVLQDPRTGTERRMTLAVRPVLFGVCAVLALPVLVGLGAAWKSYSDVSGLQANYQSLKVENDSYRAATEALTGQIESLQGAMADLYARSALEPTLARAMERLPALVKARAMGGGTAADSTARQTLSALTSPEDTFGLLRTILEGLESKLHAVRQDVERRTALAAATPSIWPAHGWLSSTMGSRVDPMTGGDDFHPGLDIAGERGQPVYSTAAGTVRSAAYRGNYGNLIVLDHGFGLETRYGHLLDFTVKAGDQVKRGDIIGHLGATGRATGYHLHYEVLANGALLNPLRLLTQQQPRAE